jgi:hypothetical protein
VRTDRRPEVELINKSLLATEFVRVAVGPAGLHPPEQFLPTEIQPNHCHSYSARLPESMTEFFPGVEVLPFFGERGDKQHGAPCTEVVFA